MTESAQRPAQASLPIARRSLLKAGMAGFGLTSLPLAAQGLPEGFSHGVASGEPGPDRALLWTRYGTPQQVPLRWEVAETLDFARAVAGGDVFASPDHDGCAKAWASGLAPGRWYYYRFVAPDGTMSPAGRTRTLPEGETQRFRMAVFSCSNIGFGWFNAYAHAAEHDAFDLAVHLGDYYYEYGPGRYPSAAQALPGRRSLPAHEAIALADYRQRHADYRSDADLQRLTQLYPMVFAWDDHETANDSWKDGAENHQSETEGPWDVRKAAALRAYREWLPVSDEPYAEYRIGTLASLLRLDTRLAGRERPFDIGRIAGGAADDRGRLAALTAFRDGAWRDPAQQMLGSAQETWLADALTASRRDGVAWQVLANQVVMGAHAFPPELVAATPARVPPEVGRRLQAAALANAAGLPASMDAWDGYPAARDRLLAAAQEAEANLVVLAGDSHNAWAFDLARDGKPAGVEFAGQSVTSPGFETGVPWIPSDRFERAMVAHNPQLVWADLSHRGYMAVELTPGAASCEWRLLDTIRQRTTALAGRHRMSVARGANVLAA